MTTTVSPQAPLAIARNHYSTVSVFLHWTIALLIVLNVVLGIMMGLHVRSVFPLHMTVGLSVLLLSIVRLGWRLGHPWLPLPENMAGWEKALARFVHVAFYVAMIGVPILGWMAVSASTRGGPALFGINIPRLPVAQDHDTHETLGSVHTWLAFATVGLLVLHVAGAIKHTYMQKDHELARMIPDLKTPD